MARDNRVRVSDDELELLREAKEVWWGDGHQEISDGKAIGTFADFIITDQSPPPEEQEVADADS